MNQDIYFPIRSNINFFVQQANQPSLVSKIKLSIIMYDNLIFDDGAYQFLCSTNGAFDMNIPPDKLQNLSFPDVPAEPGTNFHINAIQKPTGQSFNLIPKSTNGNNYVAFASFRKLINKLGIQNEDFIRFEWRELNESGKRYLDKLIKSSASYKNFIEGNVFFQDYILKNFHYSSILAEDFNTPMMIDSLHNKLLTHIMSKLVNIFDVRLEVLNRVRDLLQFELPDFSLMTMNDVLELRRDTCFIAFRNKLLDINNYLTKNKVDQFDLSKIESLFMNELIKEIREIAPSSEKLLLDGFLGTVGLLVPGASPMLTGIGLARDIEELREFNKSWIAFIIKNKK
uniref:Uncharacterized protein n=1 Tax=Candidatus Methanophaga sp. ANME-1 ERB7 TaxID=2759913 RepID=A0A7G9Z288_9EURY|nr:hypothetical protein DIMBOPOO_00045 [Methanosarcinales archaeon ANME-1 ERB7]